MRELSLRIDIVTYTARMLSLKQGDSTTLTVEVYQDGTALTLADYTLVLNMVLPNQAGLIQADDMVVSDNTVTITLNPSAVVLAGKILFELQFYQNSTIVSTYVFMGNVEPSALNGINSLFLQSVTAELNTTIMEALQSRRQLEIQTGLSQALYDALSAAIVDVNAKVDTAVTAKDTAVEAKETAVSARDITVTAKDTAVSARDTTVAAKDIAVAAKNSAEAAKIDAETAKAGAEAAAADMLSKSTYDPQGYNQDVFAYIDRVAEAPRYGVSGVGGASPTLTRIWDNVDKVAMVSTDTADPSYQNDFDSLAPFNRRKCVGTWGTPVNGKSAFTVGAYYGDPDYTEDGSKGDYVAVEIDPLWYYQDLEAGIIGVSAGRHSGWSVHPVCIDKDGSVRNKTYLPCYSLVMVDGKAASLPEYFPESGSYKGLWDECRTYNSSAILEPMAVRHYEWLLFTIEFATTNCQSVMAGATSMPYSNSADYQATVATTGETGNNKFILANAAAAQYVVGQTLAMGTAVYAETYKRIITAIEDYDANNKALVFDGDALDVPVGFWSNSRPWKSGTCNDVLKPSGSPASNSDYKHPMRYRYRENIWGNLYSTCGDLIDKLEGAGTEENPYRIEWYFLVDTDYYPSSASKPDATDLASNAWEKLGQTTEHVSGYIKVMTPDADYPHCIVPTVQTGGSSVTYYCDYGYFVNGVVGIRAVRLGGALRAGSIYGVLFFIAHYAVSYVPWSYGGGLYFVQ